MGVLRVEVIDSGAGIALEDQKKVFGQFAQFNRNELQGGGSGLFRPYFSFLPSYSPCRRLWLGPLDIPTNHPHAQGIIHSTRKVSNESLFIFKINCIWIILST